MTLMLDDCMIIEPVEDKELIKIVASHSSGKELELITDLIGNIRTAKTNGHAFEVIADFRFETRLDAMNNLIKLLSEKNVNEYIKKQEAKAKEIQDQANSCKPATTGPELEERN